MRRSALVLRVATTLCFFLSLLLSSIAGEVSSVSNLQSDSAHDRTKSDEVNVAELSLNGPCKYCTYCQFCNYCDRCPCDASSNSNCQMCKYCTYCRLCNLCNSYCQPGSMVDSISGYLSTLSATLGFLPAKEELDSIDSDLQNVDFGKVNADHHKNVGGGEL